MPSSNHLENKQSSSVGYDIIGDVHGCANTLVKLLKTMGYQKNDQGYYHPSRKTIFVGDIVDRGPRIREALHIVRDMCESQQAECVLGNHELYAITYFTLLNKGGHLRYLRPHTPHHDRLIAETLAQFEKHPKDWEMMLEWFKSLPLFIEKSGLGNKMELVIGDAVDLIRKMEEQFDLVFIDAEKEQYIDYYNLSMEKLKPGGFILADNVLWSGKVLETDKKSDKETKVIKAFNEFIKNDPRVEQVIISVRDGLMLARKIV